MKSLEISIAAFAFAAVVFATAGTAGAGQKAEDLLAAYTLTSMDGDQVKLSSFRGEVVVVNFWASWCAPCRKELPLLDRWNAEWSRRGGRVVAISIDKEKRNAERLAKDAKLSLGLYHDGPSGLAARLDLPSVPCTFVLDRQGRVVTVIRSSSKDDLAELQRQVESLLASSPRSQVQKANTSSSTDGGTP